LKCGIAFGMMVRSHEVGSGWTRTLSCRRRKRRRGRMQVLLWRTRQPRVARRPRFSGGQVVVRRGKHGSAGRGRIPRGREGPCASWPSSAGVSRVKHAAYGNLKNPKIRLDYAGTLPYDVGSRMAAGTKMTRPTNAEERTQGDLQGTPSSRASRPNGLRARGTFRSLRLAHLAPPDPTTPPSASGAGPRGRVSLGRDQMTLQEEIREAHRLCSEWEQKTFSLGSSFAHCAKLESFAGPVLRAALADGTVIIDMPSEYYPPRFKERPRTEAVPAN